MGRASLSKRRWNVNGCWQKEIRRKGPTIREKSGRKYARDVTKTLNRLDQNRAENEYIVEKRQNRIDRLKGRIARREEKGKDNSRLQMRLDKRVGKIQASKVLKGAQESKRLIKTYLDKVTSDGYKVSEIPYGRIVEVQAMYTPTFLYYKSVRRPGTLYNVKNPKDD